MDQCEDQPTTQGSERPSQAPNNAGRNAYRVAVAALIISVAAPFGEDALFGKLNIRTPMAYRVAEATQELNRLDQQSAELERRLAAVTAQLATQQTRIGEADARIGKSQAWTHTLALVQLGAALRRPGPFDLELTMVRNSAANPPELDPLLARVAPYAATGVPGIAQLQRDFVALRGRVDSLQYRSTPMGWMSRLIDWPRHAWGSRSAAASPPDPTGKYFDEAAGEMARDNLAGAVAMVQQVTGLARELLSDWMEDAEARVALDELSRQVNELVVQRLAVATGQPANGP